MRKRSLTWPAVIIEYRVSSRLYVVCCVNLDVKYSRNSVSCGWMLSGKYCSYSACNTMKYVNTLCYIYYVLTHMPLVLNLPNFGAFESNMTGSDICFVTDKRLAAPASSGRVRLQTLSSRPWYYWRHGWTNGEAVSGLGRTARE